MWHDTFFQQVSFPSINFYTSSKACQEKFEALTEKVLTQLF